MDHVTTGKQVWKCQEVVVEALREAAAQTQSKAAWLAKV